MVGNATKYYLSAAVLAAALAAVYALPDYRFYGTIVLGAAALAFLVLFGLSVAAGDPASADREREHNRPTSRAWWPVIAAFGAALVTVGLVYEPIYTYAGLALLAIATIEWTISAWADRHSDDPVRNKSERDRLLRPIEAPLFAVVAIAVPVFLVSRVFLALTRNSASYAGIAISVLVLGVAFAFYALPSLRREVIALVVAVSAVGALIGGVVALSAGERDFEHHGEEHQEEGTDESDAATEGAESGGQAIVLEAS